MNNFEIFINIFLMVDLGDRRRDKQKKTNLTINFLNICLEYLHKKLY
jgi:hypothetical protein